MGSNFFKFLYFISVTKVLQQQADEVASLEKELRELQICAKTLLEKKEQEEKILDEKEKHLTREEQGEYKPIREVMIQKQS